MKASIRGGIANLSSTMIDSECLEDWSREMLSEYMASSRAFGALVTASDVMRPPKYVAALNAR